MANRKKHKQSKVVLEFWLKQGWMQYVSLKKAVYRNIPSYVQELYEKGNGISEYLEKMLDLIEEVPSRQTATVKKELSDLDEILETIDLELTIIHEEFELSEIYHDNTTYEGVELYCTDESIIPYGFVCYIESLDNPKKEKSSKALLLIDQPTNYIELLYAIDEVFEMVTTFDPPNIHISFLSEEDCKKLELHSQRISKYLTQSYFA